MGHSTRSAEEFAELLQAHVIRTLVDVRAFPASKRFPQFNRGELAEQMKGIGVEYRHLPALGGRRTPIHDSKNSAWKNASFRAYADHMETREFEAGIREVQLMVEVSTTAIMCAEALWWKCHRGLIADYLKSKNYEVIHILSLDKTELHPYTSAARIINGSVSYKGLLG